MKKALMNASVASMIYKFNMKNIEMLQEMGYKVEVACNFGDENPISKQEINKFVEILKENNIDFFETECPRNILSFRKMVKTYFQLKKIINSGDYDLIHTQSPIGGVLCRLAAIDSRQKGTKVIYTAHGFHFFKGSPIQNWLLYYPIEKFCSGLTDTLITINHEDYDLAKKNFNAKSVKYIPGVGVNIERFENQNTTKEMKRKELGIPQNSIVLLSVGELSQRKNHQIVIKALGEINKEKTLEQMGIYYIVAGKGEDRDLYLKLAREYGISKHIILLGSRTDIDELCIASDIFVHPSIREGLGIAPLEGMAAGLPLISSYVNGIKDYTENEKTGICINNPLDIDEMQSAILRLTENSELRKKCGEHNINVVRNFSLEASEDKMAMIYDQISGGGYSHLLKIIIRRNLGLGDDEIVIMSVGEVNDNKNHKLLIESLAVLNNSNIHYVIVGTGDKMEDLKLLSKQLMMENNVHFLGYRNDVPDLLKAIDLFAFPSIREGLGLAAIEAMASGVPVIGMRTRGIREYVINGQTGFLFDNTKESCSHSIESYLKLEPQEIEMMKRNCIEKSKEFDVKITQNVMSHSYMDFA